MRISFLSLIILSVLFYGVVGQDKTWLLTPCLILNHIIIFIWLVIIFLKKKKSEDKLSKNSNDLSQIQLFLSNDTFLWFIFLIFSILLYFSSSIPFESKKEIFYLSGIIGAYLFWRNSLLKFKYKTTFFGALLTVVMLLALYGLVVHFKHPDSILWTTRYTDHYLGRLSSTYICPNHFAHLLQMLIPFCICYLFIPKGSFYVKCVCVYSILIFLPTLFLTESRAGWLGTITCIGVIICAFSLLKSKRLFFTVLLSIPILISLIFFMSWKYSETFQRRMKPVVTYFQNQNNGNKGSDSRVFRPQTWSDTIDMISDKPLLGFGPGTYNYTFQKYRKSFQGERIITGHPHNEYLELIVDYGIIGFLLFSIAWIYSIFLLIKSSIYQKKMKHKLMSFASFSMMMGTMVHSFFDFQMHIYPNALTFSFLLAMGFNNSNFSSNSFFRKKNNEIHFFSLLVSFLMLFLCLQLKLSSLFLSLSKSHFHNNALNNNKSKSYALTSLKIDRGNWESIKQLGLYYNNLRYYNLSKKEKLNIANHELEYFRKAYALNQYDAEIYVGLAKPLIFLGKSNNNSIMVEQGIENLRTACSFKKYNNIYYWLLASELRKNDKLEESLQIFKKMSKKDFKSSIYSNIEWIEKMLGLRTKKVDNSNKKVDINSDKSVNFNQDTLSISDFLIKSQER